jgi:hypothetical protein
MKIRMPRTMKTLIPRLLALVLSLCLLPVFALAEDTGSDSDWVNFLLICNEGMNNDKGNAGNTMMLVAMNPEIGKIRLIMFTWDTFIDYEGYDVPQKLDMPYRNNGAEECMKIFNANFGMNIEYYMSLNYLNLANLIDEYGGVNVDISRAERNALNGMVASKKASLQDQVGSGFLSQAIVEMLAQEYYLTEFGPNTHLNGLQAVGFGWLQYDSVYNCCGREAKVIANLFDSVGKVIADHVTFYTNENGAPESARGRAINLDDVTEEDYKFLREQMDPIFRMSYNNLSEETIQSLSLALARVAYQGSRQGVDIFEALQFRVFPLEAKDPYDIIAGTKGHLIDKDANIEAIKEFLAQD